SPGSPGAIFDFLNLESLMSVFKSLEDSNLGFLLYPLYIASMYPDKVEHLILYAGFGFLLYMTLKNSAHPAFKDHAIGFAIIIGILYGASDELHQFFVPGRTASIMDLVADSLGVVITQGLILVSAFLKKKQDRKTENAPIKYKGAVITFDLNISVILIILSALFILVPPFSQTLLRIVFALPFLLFLSGYLLMCVMFPKHGELSPIERFTLSIGLSIAIFVFDGFALNYTPWGFRPNSIVISLSLIMGLLLLPAYFQRWRFREEGYSFSISDIVSFYQTLKSKETAFGPEYDPALEKTLIITMVIAILLVSAMLIYAKVTTEPEKYTALYILGANGKAENYLSEVYIGEPASIIVGVENYEYAPVNYTLVVKLGEKTLNEQKITLQHDGKWLKNVTFIPQLTSSNAFVGANRSKLEFQLYKDNKPYRSVHLLVNVRLDSVKFAELPELTNGNMESDIGWKFLASSPSITGGYGYTTNTSSRVFEINFTAENQGSYGAIFQYLSTNGYARAILSFDVKDSEYSNASYYVFKQVLLDEKVIWESAVGGRNSTWEHVEVPVLFSGDNRLSFRVYNKYKTNLNVSVWVDNVQLRPYGIAATEIKKAPDRRSYEFKFDIRGEPHPLEKHMRFDGFSFPGFNYDFNENRSYEDLNLEFSEGNIIDAGNATYTTRVNGTELDLMGSHYYILSRNDNKTNISKLYMPESKTLMLGDTWIFGDYSISVKLVSSRGDSAMLELRRSGKILDSRLVNNGGIYEYKLKTGKTSMRLFKARIASISGDEVYLTNIELLSDILTLEPGTFIGDFEVINVSSDEIIFKNNYPIELEDETAILNGSMGLRLSKGLVYPYTSAAPLRGTPQNISTGKWMNITGFNYPGFYLVDDTSYEELSMYFASNGLVEPGQAVYKTTVHSGALSLLGQTYEVANMNRPGYISNIKIDKRITLSENETQALDRYNISFKNINEDSIMLVIRRTSSKERQSLLNQTLKSNTSFFPDVYYEMFTGKDNNLRKSNVMEIGDTFQYLEEFREDTKFKAVAGELESIDNGSIELNVRVYDIPFELYPGKTYGEFEVDSITSGTITLKNTKPLQFVMNEDKTILNGALKIRTLPKEYTAYPTR
ncbi:MAG TPA: VanZ family protein, partial [Candidatus Methanoperedens sp.]